MIINKLNGCVGVVQRHDEHEGNQILYIKWLSGEMTNKFTWILESNTDVVTLH